MKVAIIIIELIITAFLKCLRALLKLKIFVSLMYETFIFSLISNFFRLVALFIVLSKSLVIFSKLNPIGDDSLPSVCT